MPADAPNADTLRSFELTLDPAIIDRSIRSLWGWLRDHHTTPDEHYQEPGLEEPDPEAARVVNPAARARRPGRRAPCFANRNVLTADEIYGDLQKYVVHMGDQNPNPVPAPYGSCMVKDGELRDARGTLVADLGCGIGAKVPGVLDHLGFEVGASGRDVAAAYPGQEAVCLAVGEQQTSCWFVEQRDDDESAADPHTRYTFAAVFAEAKDRPLRGARARAFIEANTIVEFDLRMTCH